MDPKRRECYAVRVKLSLPAPIAYTQVEDKLCTYFQSNEGGNFDVDSVRLMGVDADGSWYKVAFVEQSGVTKMLARSDHEMVNDGIKIPLEVQGCPAPLPGTSESASSEENLSDELQEDEQLIEVNGVRRSTETEFVKLYFENPRKSGGGEIKMLVRESKIGAISITFKDQSVASIVAGRKHKLSGTTLNVKLITKKKRPPLPINARCLFLEGIPDGCSSEHVKLFIDNRASMDEEPTIQYGEKPGTAICTFSREIPDLEHVIRNISQRKLRGASLRAEKVQHSDAILVQGVLQDLEMVELYFDNKKKSGSSGVRDVQPGPMDGQAIVYFEDWKVVQDVLTKGRHKLGGKHLQIESYHDFLGRLSPLDAPTPHIPKPVSVEVHEPTMDFFYGKGENTKKKVLKDLAKDTANLLRPDGSQKSQAKLEPVEDDSQHQSSWLNWEKKAVDVPTDFMRGYKTARVSVSQTLWKDVADALKKENLQDDPQEDEPEEDEQLIVVTGLKQSTDLELLKLYFESPRKSGGDEIETLEREPKTGAISITFKDQSVSSTVAERKHKLLGATLNVKLITRKKRPPLPINARCLFLEGIPDGCSSEHLKLFIDNRASMDEEPTIQYGEKPGTAICTFSREIPDLEHVIGNISQRKLRGASLRAEKVQHSDAILVQGVLQDLEMVELYFDNKKKSGSSGVRDVQPGPMDGQAIVYFEDWKVVQDVLTKGHHKLGGKDLQIESYHDFLGRLSPLDAPTPHIPKPVLIEVHEPTMEFLYGKGENTMKKLLKDLAKVKANLLWPDGSQKSRAKLEPVVDESQHQSSWLNWEKEAVDVLTDFMGGCKAARVPVSQTLWKDEADALQKENLQDDPEEDEPEEDEQLIVVTGMKQSTDLELLKLYFESPRKSGGGEIETVERESKTGAIIITFKDPSVTSIVAGRKHKLSGAALNVKLITKKKRRPLPINARCLFLEGIPDGCSSEHVKLFIESRASMDEEPTIQYGERPGTAICTFSRDIPDLEDVIRNISQRKLRGASLRAEKVQHSDAILVQGVPQELEMVELYFDNKKMSGGSGVREVKPGPMDEQVIVYFEDWKVVQDVLTKGRHKVCGKDLQIVSYHDFMGRLGPLDAPTTHIPKPVSIEVQESIMEFLYGKGENTKKRLLKELAMVKANLLWPDGFHKSRAKLEPVIGDSQHQSSWLKWEKKAVDVLTDFMREYKTARVPVPQTLWKDAVDKLQKMTTACSMVPDAQLHEVILVGEQRDVDVAEATINDIIKKLQKDADYDAEQTKEDITWDVEKLQLFTMCGIKQEIEKSFPALKITVFSSYGKTGITLDGIRKTIKDVKLKIRRRMDCLEKTKFKSGSTKVRFVQHVPDTIREVLGSNDIHAACSGSDDGKITIYGATARDVREAKAYIDNEIDEDTIEIKGQSALAVLQGHDGKRLFDSINKQKFVLAGISHEPGGRFIKLAGFKRHLEETQKHILDFLKKKVIIKSTIPSNKNKIRLITTYHGQELEKVKQQHQQNLVAIQAQMSGRNRGFIIQGNEEGLEAVRKLVTSLVQAVKEKHYPVSKTGMARLFREEKGKKFLESVEREFHCVITTDCIEESDDDKEEEGAGHASTATRTLYSFTLPESRCRLRVCQGDLTMQRVDCIVNAANVELKHIGGLAAAVLKAGGPVIQTESDDIRKQKKRKLHVGEAVLTSSGNLPCKKVIHVAGPRWQAWGRTTRGGVTNEEQQLLDAVLNCLQLASEQKFQSIAIPAVSTGVYGFPVQLAAEQFLNAVGQFVRTTPNSSITDISLTNHDQPTCAVFMQAVAKRFASCVDDQAGVTMAAADILAGKFSAAINIGVKDDKKKEELQETVILQLSAMDMNSLMKASAKLDRFLIEVIWKYSTPLGMVSYDEEVNAILEEAYQKKKTTVALDLQGGKAVIDFQQMQEILNGSVVKHIHRVNLKIAARSEPPSNWTQMDQREFTKMVKLSVGSAEYTAVETKFRASMSPFNNIVEIERIQNRDLMMTYQARRAALVHRLNRTTVEKVLYHGTDEQTSKKIISHGFNRSFGGKNATAYGNGTYFAVAASYSANPQYAKPNANGTKHIFVTNVLVGDYIRGSHGMITPPPKPQNPAELFDSVVDNMNAPGIYVIFHDAQAYPQYLIKFK